MGSLCSSSYIHRPYFFKDTVILYNALDDTQLLSSMGLFAVLSVFAAIGIVVDVVARPPVQTSYGIIKISIRFPSIVLPVMRVHT